MYTPIQYLPNSYLLSIIYYLLTLSPLSPDSDNVSLFVIKGSSIVKLIKKMHIGY